MKKLTLKKLLYLMRKTTNMMPKTIIGKKNPNWKEQGMTSAYMWKNTRINRARNHEVFFD